MSQVVGRKATGEAAPGKGAEPTQLLLTVATAKRGGSAARSFSEKLEISILCEFMLVAKCQHHAGPLCACPSLRPPFENSALGKLLSTNN